jgi:hypothetical protein
MSGEKRKSEGFRFSQLTGIYACCIAISHLHQQKRQHKEHKRPTV